MPTLDVKARRYIIPVKATVSVIDNDFWAKGDSNRDGAIDGTDLENVRALHGEVKGSPKYNPDYDFNGDGTIDAADVSICIVGQGQVAPEYTTPFTIEVPVGKCTLYGKYKGVTVKAVAEMAEANTKKVTFIFGILYGRPFIR